MCHVGSSSAGAALLAAAPPAAALQKLTERSMRGAPVGRSPAARYTSRRYSARLLGKLMRLPCGSLGTRVHVTNDLPAMIVEQREADFLL